MRGEGPSRKRNFNHRVELHPKYGERIWKVFEQAIYMIYNHNASVLNFKELYRTWRWHDHDRRKGGLQFLKVYMRSATSCSGSTSCTRFVKRRRADFDGFNVHEEKIAFFFSVCA